MRKQAVAIVGAAETTELGKIPRMSQLQLHADAALNTLTDAGLKVSDIDGVATAGESPTGVAHYLGITPKWVDGTSVGGCSFMIHVRHAVAAIASGLCTTVLITHGESGRSQIGRGGFRSAAASLSGQFEAPYGPMGPSTLFTLPVLRYMKDYGLTHEQLAMVAVVQRPPGEKVDLWASSRPLRVFSGLPLPTTRIPRTQPTTARRRAWLGRISCRRITPAAALSGRCFSIRSARRQGM